MLGSYWSDHHAMFRLLKRTRSEILWLHIFFLAFVSLLLFSTTLIANYHTEPIALAVYGGNLVLAGLSLLPICFHAMNHRKLVDPCLPAAVIAFG